jgi:hypothetical protein
MIVRVFVFLVMFMTSLQASGHLRERSTAAGAKEVLIGQRVQEVITLRDRPCIGSFDPCRVFRVSVDKAGIMRASLAWPGKANGLRLELWNGDNADAKCCRSGEVASIAVAEGDDVEIHVVFVTRQETRQMFVLTTSLQLPQD